MTLAQITELGWANGLSSLMIVVTAVIVGVSILVKAYRSPVATGMHYGLGVAVMALGAQWFVAGSGVLLLAFLDFKYSALAYFLILATDLSIAIAAFGYVIFNPKFFDSKVLTNGGRVFLWALSAVVIITEVLVLGSIVDLEAVFQVDMDSYDQGVISMTYVGVLQIVSVVAAFSLLFFSLLLLYAGWKASPNLQEAKLRTIFLGLGLFVFFAFAIVDAVIMLDPLPLFLIRLIIAISFVLLLISVHPPKLLFRWFFGETATHQHS